MAAAAPPSIEQIVAAIQQLHSFAQKQEQLTMKLGSTLGEIDARLSRLQIEFTNFQATIRQQQTPQQPPPQSQPSFPGPQFSF